MLFDEEYAKTKMLHTTRLHEAEQERLAAEARRHTQQVLINTAQSLRTSHPEISLFDVIGMVFAMLFRRQSHAN